MTNEQLLINIAKKFSDKRQEYANLKQNVDDNIHLTVYCAANMFEDGTLVLGARHNDEIMLHYSKIVNKRFIKQGFYTNWQRFVTREEAMVIACEQGQIYRPEGTHQSLMFFIQSVCTKAATG